MHSDFFKMIDELQFYVVTVHKGGQSAVVAMFLKILLGRFGDGVTTTLISVGSRASTKALFKTVLPPDLTRNQCDLRGEQNGL